MTENKLTDEKKPLDHDIADVIIEPSTSALPEKFQGKSVEDVAKAYSELEKVYGRQSRELGDIRKLADELIKTQLVKPQVTPEEKVDIFTDPDAFVNDKINHNPDLQNLKQAAIAMKRSDTLSKLKEDFPDYKQVVDSAEFQDWVSKSKIRSELYLRADKGLDFDSANELLTNWKEKSKAATTQQVQETIDKELDKDLKAAGTVKQSGSSDGSSSKKVYRRADIIRLQVTDPKRYEQLVPEIRQAYAEGRVK